MQPRSLFCLLGATTLATGLLSHAALAQDACSVAHINGLGVPALSVTATVAVPAVPATATPAYCRVTGTIATDGEGAGPNQAGFKIDLPLQWNGKLLFLGGGGFDGDFYLVDGSAQQLGKGYATSSTNSGHDGDPPIYADARFAITSPGVPNRPALVDYFYRSHHQVAIVSKNLISAYYAGRITRSYFQGCSNGGREALMEASRYPDDFDGIIAGAPWMDPLGTELWTVKNVRALLHTFLPPALLPKITAAVLDQCDSVDGVRDGIIANPARCSFNPYALVPSVLTRRQADALLLVMRPITDSDGNILYPGTSVSDLGAQLATMENTTPASDPTAPQPFGDPNATGGVVSPLIWGLAYGTIDYLALYQPDFNLNSDSVELDGQISVAERDLFYGRLRPDLADDPALAANYLRHGGKLILYHGWSDSTISPYRSVLFYETLARLGGGYDTVRQGSRLFMVPDMEHCSGSSTQAPDAFGNTTLPPGYPTDGQHYILSALEDWVERGRAPTRIVASYFSNDDSAAGTVQRSMPLCPYPEEPRYLGSGNINDQANWTCRPVEQRTGPDGWVAGDLGPLLQPAFPRVVIH